MKNFASIFQIQQYCLQKIQHQLTAKTKIKQKIHLQLINNFQYTYINYVFVYKLWFFITLFIFSLNNYYYNNVHKIIFIHYKYNNYYHHHYYLLYVHLMKLNYKICEFIYIYI